MRTLIIDLFKAQNTAPKAVFQAATDLVETCRIVGYVREFDGHVAAIRWPFAGPAQEKYDVLVDQGMPKGCMKLTK